MYSQPQSNQPAQPKPGQPGPPSSEVGDLFNKPSGLPFERDSKPNIPETQEKLSIAKILLFVGVASIFIGATLAGLVTVRSEPDEGDYDNMEEYYDDVDSFQKGNKWLFFLGDEFIYIGVLCLITGFSFSALTNKNLHPTVRMGLLITSGLVLGLLLTNKPGLMSIFGLFE
mgnify:CR=1 FL=1